MGMCGSGTAKKVFVGRGKENPKKKSDKTGKTFVEGSLRSGAVKSFRGGLFECEERSKETGPQKVFQEKEEEYLPCNGTIQSHQKGKGRLQTKGGGEGYCNSAVMLGEEKVTERRNWF